MDSSVCIQDLLLGQDEVWLPGVGTIPWFALLSPLITASTSLKRYSPEDFKLAVN
jgi:hypothetical protein